MLAVFALLVWGYAGDALGASVALRDVNAEGVPTASVASATALQQGGGLGGVLAP